MACDIGLTHCLWFIQNRSLPHYGGGAGDGWDAGLPWARLLDIYTGRTDRGLDSEIQVWDVSRQQGGSIRGA